jgi:hypothetical protein
MDRRIIHGSLLQGDKPREDRVNGDIDPPQDITDTYYTHYNINWLKMI